MESSLELSHKINDGTFTIVSWNINGIRSMTTPIRTLLDSLDADVICLQETKITRDQMDESLVNVDGYNSYFSFSRKRSGYSGVVTYCRNCATPVAAEEGLTGHRTVSKTAANTDSVGYYGNHDFDSTILQALDAEGRAILTKHLLRLESGEEVKLTIINVYCPRVDPDCTERLEFKLQFYKMLQVRAEAILNSGSHVVIIGDMNTSHKPIDHCDPINSEEFSQSPSRAFLDQFLLDKSLNEGCDKGKFVDTFRHFYPKKTNAFTCWCTRTAARHTNYGSRIDYIFADLELVKTSVVSDSTILPEVLGSDHCPVKAILKCSSLPATKCPSLCSRYWPEFSGKQTKLSSFLKQQQLKRKLVTENIPGKLASETVPEKRKPSSQQKEISSFFSRKTPTTEETKIRTDSDVVSANSKSSRSSTQSSTAAWKAIFKGPVPPPLCSGHNEECVLKTVKKQGPNFKRDFYTCARPEGHASNPESSCNFFKWASTHKSRVTHS